MNIDREPRYYAWISFHNGYYECQGRYYEGSGHNAYEDSNFRGINNMKVLTQFMRNQACGVQQRSNNYSPTGFLNKKKVFILHQIQEEVGIENTHGRWSD